MTDPIENKSSKPTPISSQNNKTDTKAGSDLDELITNPTTDFPQPDFADPVTDIPILNTKTIQNTESVNNLDELIINSIPETNEKKPSDFKPSNINETAPLLQENFTPIPNTTFSTTPEPTTTNDSTTQFADFSPIPEPATPTNNDKSNEITINNFEPDEEIDKEKKSLSFWPIILIIIAILALLIRRMISKKPFEDSKIKNRFNKTGAVATGTVQT